VFLLVVDERRQTRRDVMELQNDRNQIGMFSSFLFHTI
jgi:hypothetical protein